MPGTGENGKDAPEINERAVSELKRVNDVMTLADPERWQALNPADFAYSVNPDNGRPAFRFGSLVYVLDDPSLPPEKDAVIELDTGTGVTRTLTREGVFERGQIVTPEWASQN